MRPREARLGWSGRLEAGRATGRQGLRARACADGKPTPRYPDAGRLTLCNTPSLSPSLQVARGLVLPLTVLLASVLLKTMPPPSTLVAVALVCAGFFYGITPSAASPTNASSNTQLGIVYGVLSAATIAVHAILVKWSMRHVAVKDMDATYVTNIAYLTNLLSALGLFPILILTGEVWQWPALVANEDGSLWTFLVGSLITVRPPSPLLLMPSCAPSRDAADTLLWLTPCSPNVTGHVRLLHLHGRPPVHHRHLARHAHVLVGASPLAPARGSRALTPRSPTLTPLRSPPRATRSQAVRSVLQTFLGIAVFGDVLTMCVSRLALRPSLAPPLPFSLANLLPSPASHPSPQPARHLARLHHRRLGPVRLLQSDGPAPARAVFGRESRRGGS